MAATMPLPPIGGAQKGRAKQMQRTQFAPRPAKGPPIKLEPIKKPQRKTDRDLYVKHEKLRAQQPLLLKSQTTSFRNTYKHNLCLDMLQDGFHKSYSELFALIKQQEEDRLHAGPESLMWTQTLLKDEHEKLDMLKVHLTRAEDAMWTGDFSEVYRARYELARYFQSTGDKWLADHFFTTCLQTSSQVKDDGGKMHAEGFCNVGLAQEDNGDYHDAMVNFESYQKLASENKDWMKTADQMSFYTDSCINLWRIYTTIGDRLEMQDPAQSLEYFIKAHSQAKDSLDRKLEGEAAYRLGLAYEKSGDGETALLHLNNYLDTCNAAEDSDGIGRACDAIAKAYARQGKVEESIDYLKKYVQVTEKSGQEKAYSKACHNLGAIFNSLGRYEEATEYFSKAYNLSRALSDGESISTNRVQFGISMAHKMMQGVSSHIVQNKRSTLERLVEWKSARTDEFDKPIPEPKTPEPPKPLTPLPPPAEEDEEEEKSEEQDADAAKDDEEAKGDNTAASTADTMTEDQSETTDSG